MDMPHVTLAIDRLRETQLAHGIILNTLATRQEQIIAMMQDLNRDRELDHEGRGRKAILGMNGLMRGLRPLLYLAVLWAVTVLSMAYLANGGDLMSAATFLLGR